KQALLSFLSFISQLIPLSPLSLSLPVDEPPLGPGFHDNQPASQPAGGHDSS
ncbi:hypothetical protein M9458_045299, partial [Cirrhinus mrigala]